MSNLPEGYVSVTSLGEGALLLVRTDGTRVIASIDDRGTIWVDEVRAGHATVRSVHESTPTFSAKRGHAEANDGRVLSPTSGMLRSIVVAVGDDVTRGMVLGHVEAMKMHIELRASADGVVAAIDAKAGDRVERGSLLLRITPAIAS